MSPGFTRSIAVILAFFLGVSACGRSDSTDENAETNRKAPKFADGSSLARVQKSGKLIVGVSFDKPGFGFRDPSTNTVNGFDAELAKLMSQRIFGGKEADAASKVEYVETISRNRAGFLQQGRVDIVIADYVIDAADADVDFSAPYYVAHGDLLTKTSNANIKALSDVNGKRVCAVDAQFKSALLVAAKNVKLVAKDTYPQCIEALTKDGVEAVAGDDAVLASNASSSGGAIQLKGLHFSDLSYGIAVKKGDHSLTEFLTKQLQEIGKNGDWQKAYDATVKPIGLPALPPPGIS